MTFPIAVSKNLSSRRAGLAGPSRIRWTAPLTLLAVWTLIAAPLSANKPPSSAPEPQAVPDLSSALAQTSAIVEGVATTITSEYSDAGGPWTAVTLSPVKAHFGTAPKELVIRQFGGELPDGRILLRSHQVRFVAGKTYIVFLRNTSWNLSPIVGELAFRVEAVQGQEMLVANNGSAVTDVASASLKMSDAIFEKPDLNGQAPGLAKTAAGQPIPSTLDRSSFIASLGRQIKASGATISGPFFDEPAGNFKWNGMQTVRPTLP